MRILVTGASGQVGRSMLDLNGRDGHEIIGLTRQQFDLKKPEEFDRIVDQVEPDAIVNAAAYTMVDRAEDEPELAHQINAVAPGVMAHVAEKNNIRFIQISTDYVFDGKARIAYKEKDQPYPINCYGKTKLSGELAVLEQHSNPVVLRTSWVFSTDTSGFPFKIRMKLLTAKEDIYVVNDQTGCPTSSWALSNVVVQICRQKSIHGVYHFSGEEQLTWFDFAQRIRQALEIPSSLGCAEILPISTEALGLPATRPMYSVLDLTKLKTSEINLPNTLSDIDSLVNPNE